MNKDKTLTIYNTPIVLAPELLDQAKDLEDFESLWMISKEIDQRNQWFKGDILDKFVIKFGEASIEEFAKTVGEKPDTLIGYRRVSRAFPIDKRMFNLSWTHYWIASQVDSWNKEKQQFETEKRFEWITEAHDNNWSVPKLKSKMALQKAIDSNDLFSYYTKMIIRFGNIIKHWDLKPLSENQRDMLIKTLDDVVSDIKNCLNK